MTSKSTIMKENICTHVSNEAEKSHPLSSLMTSRNKEEHFYDLIQNKIFKNQSPNSLLPMV